MRKALRKLTLSRETVWTLSPAELPKVAGGDSYSQCSCSGPRVCGTLECEPIE